MSITWRTKGLLTALFAATSLIACGGGSSGQTPDGDAIVSGTPSSAYMPFATANLTEQMAHVDAYERIRTIRAKTDFAASDFGNLVATSPTGGTIADIYVHTPGLRDKVVGRTQSHPYGAGAGTNALGKAMDAVIAKAIADGAAGKDPKVHGQIIHKTLQRFFYESVFHELSARSATAYDVAFGYTGLDVSGDRSKAKGIAATAVARDERFSTDFHGTIFQEFLKGKAALDQKVAGAATGVVAKGQLPALEAAITEIDQQWLRVFAYSAGYEFVDVAKNAEPGQVLAEAAMYFEIIEDFMKTRDADAAAYVRAQVDATPYDRATTIDTTGIAARINKTFGIDVTR
jgi:hypothetical protein